MSDHGTTPANLAPPREEPSTTSPSKKPKKRPSFFLAKVRSIFQDSQSPKTVISQSRPAVHQRLPTSDPPISPPHSPGEGTEAKLGSFEFEKHRGRVPAGSMGAREQLSSLTPSNSSTVNARASNPQRISQNSETGLQTDSRCILQVPVSNNGVFPKGSNDVLSLTSSTPMRLESLGAGSPSLLLPESAPIVDRNNSSSAQLLPLDDLEYRLDAALADYLIALCNEPTQAERNILRNFFSLRLAEHSDKSARLSSSEALSASPAIPALSRTAEELNNCNGRIAADLAKDPLPADAYGPQIVSSPSDAQERLERITTSHSVPEARTRLIETEEVTVSSAGCPESQSRCSHSEGRDFLEPAALDTSPSPSVPAADSTAHELAGNGVPSVHPSRKITIDDFDLIRTLGKGCAGKVSPRFSDHQNLSS